MSPENKQLTQILTRLSIVMAIIVGATAPIGYGFFAYYNLAESLEFKAKIKAYGQTELITTMPDVWMFAENQIHGLLQHEPVILKNELVEIYDVSGRLITTAGGAVKQPQLSRSYPLYDIDTIVGEVVVSASLVDILENIAVLTVLAVVAGGIIVTIMRLIPIRQLRKLSTQLNEEKERAFVTLNSINDAVLRTDTSGCVRFINSVGEKMLGLSLQELKGRPITDVLKIKDSTTGEPIVLALTKTLNTHTKSSCNSKSILEIAGKKIAIEERAAPIFDDDGKLIGAVLSLRDVSIARNYLERRSWEASHDPLTEILNRRAFQSSIDDAIYQAHKNHTHYILCFMDLDRFKVINDSCGHAAGDELLKKITNLLQDKLRKEDVLARLGGDEFGLLLEGCSASQGEVIANELINSVEKFQFIWDEQIFTVGISIGLTTISRQTSIESKDLLSEADAACYWAKEHGRNQVWLYSSNDIDLATKRSQTGWVSRITSALKDNRFVLYHQIYRTLNKGTGEHLHMEVLLRMIDESGDIIPPNQFLPAAERYDLIQDIDRWVINETFSSFHLLLNKYKGKTLRVNINLSGASINSARLFAYIEEKITEFNIDPESICFEVTETVAVTNLQRAIQLINACKEIGIKFALDDFGTGASSFTYLKNLPVDYLKIDGSFVQNIEVNSIDRGMVEAINKIGHLMGKVTIAEFAENEAIIKILDEMGVDFAQGYGVCHPIPL